MRLLDLFCGAGGAAMGYHRAGFDVVGIDNEPQPNYPFPFKQMDALVALSCLLDYRALEFSNDESYYLHEFDVIHASPPCQAYSVMTKGRWQDRLESHDQLIGKVRALLEATGKSYVIENVSGARGELINPIMLCGTMFGLQTKGGSQLRRHRYFECSSLFVLTPTCNHNNGSVIGVYGGGQHPGRRVPATIGVYGNSGGSSNRDNLVMFGTDDRRDAMDIQWMIGKELSEAIPPAYTEFIGKQIMETQW